MTDEKNSKELWLEKRADALKWLETTFPECFGRGRILKVGVWDEIASHEQADKPSNRFLRFAIIFYASRPKYLKQIKTGEPRFDLFGEKAGDVSELEEQQAVEKMLAYKERKEAQKEKKKSADTKVALKEKQDDEIINRPILTIKKKAKAS